MSRASRFGRLPMAVATGAMALLSLPAVSKETRHAGAAPDQALVYIGTQGSTIEAARLDEATGALAPIGSVAHVDRPTWLVADDAGSRLFAVSETGNDGKSQGGVYALAIDRGTGRLTVIGHTVSGGGGATHLAYDASARTLLVANYGSGDVAAIPIDADGRPGPPASVARNTGSGPSPRQRSAHAHSVVVAPGGRYVLSADLGADRVFVYRLDARTRALASAATSGFALPPGSGPRHLAFSRDGRFAFVDTELSGEVYVLRWNARDGTLALLSRIALDPAGFTGARSAAEIAVSPDGRHLYVSNRAENLVQVYAIDPRTGSLGEVQRIDSGGRIPWSFAIDPQGRWLIVANQATNNLAVFAIDGASGRLTPTANALAVTKPVAIAFVR